MSRTLLFEIGVEEIPSAPLYDAIAQLKRRTEEALRDARLEYGTVESFGAPRRLVVRVTDLTERQEDRTLRVKGPAIKAAFDVDGNPTKAAEGFARGKGLTPADLVRVEDESGAYVYAVIDEKGRDAKEVLPTLLAQLASGIDWPKSMRWGLGETRFSRPVRWLLALFGEDVVSVEFAGLTAGRETYGHRFLSPDAVSLPEADDYPTAAKRGMFLYDHQERTALVREGIEQAATSAGGTAVVPEKTFAEVVNLVEWPTVGVGRFDAEFLDVPREVIETAMTKHQRYFPVEGPDGLLTNAFIVAQNGDPARTQPILAGHERVIRARLADAAFFYREDLQRRLEEYVGDLEGIVFQEKLGTLAAKVARVEALAGKLADIAEIGPDQRAEAMRAAHLCKCDLVSHVVIEFPALQGVMGRYYALASDEGDAVATAIVEHYQPRFAGDALPSTTAGRIVSIADKLDTMAGIFGIGMPPTGSADPYALRRSAIGVLAMILDGVKLTLDEAIGAALAGYDGVIPGLSPNEIGPDIRSFFNGRLEVMLRDQGYPYDIVDAVMAKASDDPADTMRRVRALSAFRDTAGGADLATAFKRATNLGQPDLGTTADPLVFSQDEERELHAAFEAAESDALRLMVAHDYDGALAALAGLRAPIDAFFDEVLVMAEETVLRENRLRLLNRLVSLFADFADFEKLEG